MEKRKFIIILSFIISTVFSQENTKQIKYINQVWAGYYNTVAINEKWSVNSDFQFRTKDWLAHPSLGLGRTGVNYKINEKVNVSVGLAHFRYYLNDLVTRGEWRPWQEIALNEVCKKFKIVQRIRVEERFNQKTDKNHPVNSYGFNWRFRYRFDLQYLVANINDKQKIYIVVGNEIMINAGKEIVYNYFDQNRSMAGLLIELNKKFSLQPQFIYIWQQEANGKTLDQINVVRLNLIHKIRL